MDKVEQPDVAPSTLANFSIRQRLSITIKKNKKKKNKAPCTFINPGGKTTKTNREKTNKTSAAVDSTLLLSGSNVKASVSYRFIC